MNRSCIQPGDGDTRHGTENGYRNLSCRCGPCREAHALYQRQQNRRRKNLIPPAHGRWYYTNYRCRCHVCRDDHAAYRRELHARRAGA
jgi:hypothetical protein